MDKPYSVMWAVFRLYTGSKGNKKRMEEIEKLEKKFGVKYYTNRRNKNNT